MKYFSQSALLPNFPGLLLDAINEAVIATDMSGTIIYWNTGAETLYGYASDEVLGKSIYAVTVPDVSLEQAQEIMEVLGRGRPWSGEIEVATKQGSRFLADVRDVPVADGDGQLIAIIGLSRNVSEQRRMDQQRELLLNDLENANRVKDEFLTLISHELRTPLTSILGYAEMLARSPDGFNQQMLRESHADILAAARKMNRMVNELLSIYRIEKDNPVPLVTMSIEKSIDTVIRAHKSLHPDRRFHVVIPSSLSSALAHEVYLEHIIRGLIDNAENYSATALPIEVECSEAGNYLEIDVKDRGPGVPEEEREQIFQPFYRSRRTGRPAGTGLGLAISRRLAEVQNGSLEAMSRDGGGSVFRLRLPIANERQ